MMASVLVQALKNCGSDCTPAKYGAAIEGLKDFEPPLGVAYGKMNFGPTDHVGVDTIRFHTYNPTTKSTTEGDPIKVSEQP
jgi:hypothetical protein